MHVRCTGRFLNFVKNVEANTFRYNQTNQHAKYVAKRIFVSQPLFMIRRGLGKKKNRTDHLKTNTMITSSTVVS